MASDFPFTIRFLLDASHEANFLMSYSGQVKTYNEAFTPYNFPFGGNIQLDGTFNDYSLEIPVSGITLTVDVVLSFGGYATFTFNTSSPLFVDSYEVQNSFLVAMAFGGATWENFTPWPMIDVLGNPVLQVVDDDYYNVNPYSYERGQVNFRHFHGLGGDSGMEGGGEENLPGVILRCNDGIWKITAITDGNKRMTLETYESPKRIIHETKDL